MDPNFETCENFYCVSDKEAFRSVFSGGKHTGKRLFRTDAATINVKSNDSRVAKTYLTMLVRHYAWRSGRWKNKTYRDWIDHFNPDVVLIQSGDSAFILQIASEIARTRKIPLVFFNTEGYYFFKNKIYRHHWTDCLAYHWYKRMYRRNFQQVLSSAVFSIYGNQLLKDDYDAEFGINSTVLYTSSTMDYSPKKVVQNNPVFSYLGNFGFNRAMVLSEIAETLHNLNPNYRLDVYGQPNTSQLSILQSSPYINFHGFVGYDRVKEIIYNSDIVFHAESQEEQYQEALRYGFSTKIADCIASGANFILYSSPKIACAQYIQSTNSAWYVQNVEELKNAVCEILENSPVKEVKLQKAREIAAQNHNIHKNRERFRSILQMYSMKY